MSDVLDFPQSGPWTVPDIVALLDSEIRPKGSEDEAGLFAVVTGLSIANDEPEILVTWITDEEIRYTRDEFVRVFAVE